MSRKLLVAALVAGITATTMADTPGEAPDGKQSREALQEPVYRVSNARVDNPIPTKVDSTVRPDAEAAVEHPLDPAIKMAREGLQRIQSQVSDYSCTLVKQERIDGELMPQEYMYTEVRNRKVENGRVVTPFSVYMYFLKPDAMKGREVIFVEGQNDSKLVAHEGSGFLRSMGAVALDPRGKIAMRGNRYPITDVGIEFLISELVKRGERDRQRGECTAEFKPNVKINGRPCTLLEVVHPQPRPYFDFHIARVYIDDELNLPVRYEAYTWPTMPGGTPVLQECYTYLNLKVNIGLTDENFDKKRFRL
ncbi:MAG: DUF1571 domain-containing protein [Pirellulaceae bacterium]